MCPKPVFPFALQMFEFDAKVRGLYLAVACDFDRLMSEIIAIIKVNDPALREDYKTGLKLEMGAKLEQCKKALLEYNSDYLIQYKDQFDIIKALTYHRTMLAHGWSLYDEKETDMSFIRYQWIEKDGSKKTMRFDKVIIQPFVKQMVNYRDGILKMLKFVQILRQERSQ